MENRKYVDTNNTFGLMIPESGEWYQSPSPSPEPRGSPPPTLSPKTGPTRSPSDEEAKKPAGGKRGRPRVEGDEKSATERRRTQIRLAQRAYRERKEAAINTLEARVVDLEQLIGNMYQTFSDYAGNVISSGIANEQPQLGQDLHAAMERFTQLFRDADIGGDDEEEAGPSRKRSSQPRHRSEGDLQRLQQSNDPRSGTIPLVQFSDNFLVDPVMNPIHGDERMWGYSLHPENQDMLPD